MGGDISYGQISAKTGQGVDELLDLVELEVRELLSKYQFRTRLVEPSSSRSDQRAYISTFGIIAASSRPPRTNASAAEDTENASLGFLCDSCGNKGLEE